jgi:hypothetical protein
MTLTSRNPSINFRALDAGNRGRDPFGDFVRPIISPVEIVAMLGEVGARASTSMTMTWCP